LAAFEGEQPRLLSSEIAVVAASTDSGDKAVETVRRLGLSFPVGFGLPLEATAEALGAFYELRRQILHATGFVLRPGGAIAVAAYSSGAIGRLTPADVLTLVEFWKN
jgi:hypothetical protein